MVTASVWGISRIEKQRARDAVDGERRAVERDRSLLGDVFGEIGGRFEFETHHRIEGRARDDPRDAVDMAGDHMAAELVADLQRTFEIEAGAGPPAAGRRARQRLGADIDLEPCPVAVAADADSGEAWPRTGDRSAERDRIPRIGAGDPDAPQGAARLDRDDFPDIGDETGEHLKEPFRSAAADRSRACRLRRADKAADRRGARAPPRRSQRPPPVPAACGS